MASMHNDKVPVHAQRQACLSGPRTVSYIQETHFYVFMRLAQKVETIWFAGPVT